MQYTALGAEVNMASRIEGLNKYYGTTLLVSGSVEKEVREHFLFRPIDRVVPAGTSQAVELFELLGSRGDGPDAASETAVTLCARWSEAIEAYRQRDWREALRQFNAFANAYPDDGVVLIYTARCMAFLDAPPTASWDGAEHFKSK
jgi:adenylate cyclase